MLDNVQRNSRARIYDLFLQPLLYERKPFGLFTTVGNLHHLHIPSEILSRLPAAVDFPRFHRRRPVSGLRQPPPYALRISRQMGRFASGNKFTCWRRIYSAGGGWKINCRVTERQRGCTVCRNFGRLPHGSSGQYLCAQCERPRPRVASRRNANDQDGLGQSAASSGTSQQCAADARGNDPDAANMCRTASPPGCHAADATTARAELPLESAGACISGGWPLTRYRRMVGGQVRGFQRVLKTETDRLPVREIGRIACDYRRTGHLARRKSAVRITCRCMGSLNRRYSW